MLGDAETPDPPLRPTELLIRGSVAPPRVGDPRRAGADALLPAEADSAR